MFNMVKTTLERLDLRISGTVASGSESNSYNEKSNNEESHFVLYKIKFYVFFLSSFIF